MGKQNRSRKKTAEKSFLEIQNRKKQKTAGKLFLKIKDSKIKKKTPEKLFWEMKIKMEKSKKQK